MKNKEMLVWAMIAAGYTLQECAFRFNPREKVPGSWQPRLFNSLNDDGDALRLAAKLKFTIIQMENSVMVCFGDVEYTEPIINDDRYSATRIAITSL